MEYKEFLEQPEIREEYKRKFNEFLDYFKLHFKSIYLNEAELGSLMIKLANVRTQFYFSDLFNKKLPIPQH